MKLAAIALPTLLLAAACGDDSTKRPVDFATLDDLSASDDLSVGDLKLVDQAAPDLTPVGPSGMIQQVRNMADTSSTPDGGMISLPVHDVYVTYLKPYIATSTDPAGFFVQADQVGPALFVAVDPTTLSPAPQVGDLVRFNVTSVQKVGGTRQAGSIDTWSVVSSGNPTAALVKDLTAATDLVTGLEGYESELMKLTSATITSAFAATGAGYVSATFTTAGVTTMSTKLKLRLPTTLRDSLDLASGCIVAVGPTPLWRFVDTSEPSAWVAGDITVTSCPAPQVVSAIATTASTIVVTFDRQIDGGTLVGDGSQFGFDNGLVASMATLSAPTQVTLTTAAPQTGGTTYTLTVPATLKDKRGLGIDAAHATATFTGYVVPAVLILNEASLGITGGHDIVELKATTGGSIAGFKLYQDYTTGGRTLLTTLPSLIVATGDYVLVHLDPLAGGPTTETTAGGKTGCVDATCSNNAWDVNGTTTNDYALSARIVNLVRPDGTTADALPYYKGSAPAAWPTEMKAVTMGGAWLPAACPNACATAADAQSIALDVSTTPFGTTFAGVSAQRKNTNVPAMASDWQMKAGTLGADN